MISKDFSIKRMLLKLGLLLPVLALCVYLFNNEIVAKPVYTNSELSPVELQVNPQDANVLKIKMEGESIYLNGKEVKLKKLVSRLDKMAEGKSDGQLKEMNFDVKISNTNKEFIKDVDREFRRSRLARITGFSLVPPPPAPSGAVPAPSAPPAPGPPNGQPSTTPSVPEPGEKMKVLPAPPVHSHPEQDSVRRLARMEMSGEKISERMDMKRAKLEELRAERMELRKEKMDSVRAKRDAIYEEKMAERMEIVEKRHAELREKQAELKTYIKAERDRVKANMKKMQQQEKKKAEKENLGL